MTEQEKAAKEAVVAQCVSMLGEHFEAVQVFASSTSDDGGWTESIFKGSGNLWARIGQTQRWLHYQEETTRIECRQEMEQDGLD
jgi:hypothetical protein